MNNTGGRERLHWTRVILVIILSFFVVEVSLAFGRKLVVYHRIHKHLVTTAQELENLQDRNLELRQEKEALYSSAKIEQLAREKLGLTMPNEIAVEIVKKSPEPRAQQGNAQNPSIGFWGKIKEEFRF